MLNTPLLIVGDNPALPGGLARSGRDIASLAATMPEFRVGYLGRGLGQKRKFPWVTYDFPESGRWGQDLIVEVWKDFAGAADGVILTTDDPSRRRWMVNPAGESADVARMFGSGRNFALWGYFPIDGEGVGAGMSGECRATLLGFDRVLAASEWGCDVARASGRTDADWLPHGIWPERFRIVPNARELMGWDELIVVGCVMGNQARKDFPVAFDTARKLKAHWGNRFRFWLHTDTPVRYWNVYALAADYGVSDVLILTHAMSDEQLAVGYSACAATMLPSAAEGFGYPIAESLACGTGCVVTDYGGGAELTEEQLRVRPVEFRVDTIYNLRRAVLASGGFANAVGAEAERKLEDWEGRGKEVSARVAHLAWPKLEGLWKQWLRRGLRG